MSVTVSSLSPISLPLRDYTAVSPMVVVDLGIHRGLISSDIAFLDRDTWLERDPRQFKVS